MARTSPHRKVKLVSSPLCKQICHKGPASYQLLHVDHIYLSHTGTYYINGVSNPTVSLFNSSSSQIIKVRRIDHSSCTSRVSISMGLLLCVCLREKSDTFIRGRVCPGVHLIVYTGTKQFEL